MVRGWISGLASVAPTFMDFVATTAGTDLALQPGKALATVGQLYGMSMLAGSVAHVVSTALNLTPTFNWVGASQLAGFVGQASGFEPITRASYGVLLNECLSWPLRYYWDRQLRPRIPNEGEIFTMGRKRGLTRGEFNEAMAFQGLPDPWIDKIYRFFWTDPSPMWLLRMSEVSNPKIEPSAEFLPWLDQWIPDWRSDPWAWYKMKLMLAGFEDTDVPAFLDGFRRRMVASPTTQLKTSVRAMVRDAYWGRAEVEGALRPLGVRQDEIEYLLVAEDLDYQHTYLKDQQTALLEQFRKGQVSRQDLSLALSTMIVRPERVAQLVAREEVRALPAPKQVTPVREASLVKGLVTQAVTSWTAAYRAWKISLDDLQLGLTVVVQDPALAVELVRVERARYRPQPELPPPPPEDPVAAASRRAAIASWVQQYRDGKIDPQMLELGLAPLITDPALRKQVVQLESLRARPAPAIIGPAEEDPLIAQVREQTVRAHLEMFAKRVLSLQELYVYLIGDGLAEALARATALTQALKRVKVPGPDSLYFRRDQLQPLLDEAIASYTDMADRGEISLEQMRANLLAAGIDPLVAAYLVDTEEVRLFLRGG